MRIVVPYAAAEPKTRLAAVLDPEERRTFARTMLDDVLAVLSEAGHAPELLATASVDAPVPVSVDERPLTEAVNAVLAGAELPVGIVMADLPLLTVAAIDRLVQAPGDVVIAPGRGGGTNALIVRDPGFRVDYHGCSFRDHLEGARNVDAEVEVIDSHRLATDVDEPADLLETVLHGKGAAPDWLAAAGFEIRTSGGRARLERPPGADD